MRRGLSYVSSIEPAKVSVITAGVQEDVTTQSVRTTASIQVTPSVMRASAMSNVRRQCYILRATRYLVIKTARHMEAAQSPARWRLSNTVLLEAYVKTFLAVTQPKKTIVVDVRLLTPAGDLIPERACVS
ncbi:MAG TPA: hypothetical protein VFM05_03960 [Candidatus Saccharimonadales bacterium]|nr:hypothetical protein [Candidatus Saccharimonadales bacterium]